MASVEATSQLHEMTSATSCANCGKAATIKCARCSGAPEYEANDSNDTFYCKKDCEKAHWLKHIARCNVRSRRKKLLRGAQLLKTTLLAYRECVFDIDLEKIEFQDGVLYLQRRSPHLVDPAAFPSHLTSNVVYKEAALAYYQCTAAVSLLGPLTRHLLVGVASNIMVKHIVVEKPLFSISLVQNPRPSYIPASKVLHTVVVCEMRNGEQWVIDSSGCQYGYRDVLVPLHTYFEQRECHNANGPEEISGVSETDDIDYCLDRPTIASSPTLMKERVFRVHFAAFVTTHVNTNADFGKNMLSGSLSEFQENLDTFVGDVKRYMTDWVEWEEHVGQMLRSM